MKKKSIVSNYIYNLLYQILTIILPIVTTPYLARTLGAEGTGIYSYTIAVVTYFILFGSLGIALYGQREIAFVQDNKAKKTKIFYNVIILRFITMFISMLSFYFIFARNGEFSLYYKILLIEMVANVIDITWFFQGLEDFKKTAIRNILVKIISIICIFLFIKGPNDVWKYVLIYVLTTFLGNAVLWFGIKKQVNKFNFKDLDLFHYLKETFVLFIPQIAIQVYTVLDKTMIGSILNDMSEVGYYEQAQKVVKILLTIITSLGAVMMPRIAKLHADGDKEKIKEYMYNTFRFIFLLGFPLVLGIISVAPRFVRLFFGVGYTPVVGILIIFSLVILFIGFSNVTGSQYLIGTKRQKQFTISVVCGAIVNAILNFILISRYKALGATISTVIAEFTVTAIQLFFVRKDFSIARIIKSSWKYLLSALVMFGVSYIIGVYTHRRMVTLMVQVACSAITYFSMLIILKDDMLVKAKDFIINKFKNKK